MHGRVYNVIFAHIAKLYLQSNVSDGTIFTKGPIIDVIGVFKMSCSKLTIETLEQGVKNNSKDTRTDVFVIFEHMFTLLNTFFKCFYY